MGQFKDLRGQKFGKLTVIDRVSDSPRIGEFAPQRADNVYFSIRGW